MSEEDVCELCDDSMLVKETERGSLVCFQCAHEVADMVRPVPELSSPDPGLSERMIWGALAGAAFTLAYMIVRDQI